MTDPNQGLFQVSPRCGGDRHGNGESRYGHGKFGNIADIGISPKN
jgi:hypothetical protein